MTNEKLLQFRAALQMVVSAGDPRENLENFMKIGEGSTGTVCIATDRSTGNFHQFLFWNLILIKKPKIQVDKLPLRKWICANSSAENCYSMKW